MDAQCFWIRLLLRNTNNFDDALHISPAERACISTLRRTNGANAHVPAGLQQSICIPCKACYAKT